VLVLDWKMPGMDGVACAQALAKSAALRHAAPIVMMATAFGREEVRQRLADHGVQVAAVLTKPVFPSSLLDACATALGRAPVTVRSSPWRRRRGRQHDPRTALAGARVLLVEDNLINQELAVDLLSGSGIHVSVAADGREALKVLEHESFDAVLMDCQMPVMDGYEATRALRQRPELQSLPVIAMTANAMTGDREAVLAAGMDDHIAKPIAVEDMFATLARWIPARATAASTAPATGPARGTEELQALKSLDAAGALARLRGNERLLHKTLLQFLRSEHDFSRRFTDAWATGDHDAARRMSHDLYAVAATLGMEALQRCAKALELACVESDGAAVETRLTELSRTMEPILHEVGGWAERRTTAG
jgi:CheY-like chemotaxis protein/HPt (histidine-containing phosphotransfer) domain-containing protein